MPEHILPPARHETRDVAFRPMLIAAALMAAALTLTALFVLFLYPRSARPPNVASAVPQYPAPALQISPSGDMAAFYAREMAELHATGWIDRERGVAHIPIEDAMRRIAGTGIEDWHKQ